MMRVFHAVVPALVAILAWPSQATDLVVGLPGTGAPYTTIQAAVDAAQPGDRVIVLPGNYDGTIVIDGKSLELIGAGSAVTTLRALAVFSGVAPPTIAIINLAPGGRVRVTGMTFGVLGQIVYPNPYMMTVRDCAGRVELCDLDVLGAALPSIPSPSFAGIVHVQNCAHVVLNRVRALGSLTTFPFPVPGAGVLANGHSGFAIDNSSVRLMDCQADGNATRHTFGTSGGDGGHGVVALHATLHIGRSVLRGAQSGGRQPGMAGIGGAGISASFSTILVHGGSGNLIAGANAYENAAFGPLGLGTAGSAVALDALSWLAYGADVVLTPGAGSASQSAAPPINAVPGATVVAAPVRLPTVAITPAYVALGSALTVTITGEPGLDQLRAVALQTAPAVTIGGVFGALLIDLATVVVWHLEPIGPSGTASFLVPVPADPALGGLQIVEQGAQAFPGGISISPPVLATLGF